jgi:hypothetical protein
LAALAEVMPSVLPLLALAISAGSLLVSTLAYRRAGASEKVIAWLELAPTTQHEWTLATMHVKNPSRLQIKLSKLIVKLPDFRMADYESVLEDDGRGNRILPKEFSPKEHYISMPCAGRTIANDSTASLSFLLFQPSFSRKKYVTVGVMWQTMESRPKFKTIWTKVRTRSDF